MCVWRAFKDMNGRISVFYFCTVQEIPSYILDLLTLTSIWIYMYKYLNIYLSMHKYLETRLRTCVRIRSRYLHPFRGLSISVCLTQLLLPTDCQESLDYTRPEYVTLLFTDLGIFTPRSVSDELTKLFQ